MDRVIMWVGLVLLISMAVGGSAVIGLGLWGICLNQTVHDIPGFITYNVILIVLGCVMLAIPIMVWIIGGRRQ